MSSLRLNDTRDACCECRMLLVITIILSVVCVFGGRAYIEMIFCQRTETIDAMRKINWQSLMSQLRRYTVASHNEDHFAQSVY